MRWFKPQIQFLVCLTEAEVAGYVRLTQKQQNSKDIDKTMYLIHPITVLFYGNVVILSSVSGCVYVCEGERYRERESVEETVTGKLRDIKYNPSKYSPLHLWANTLFIFFCLHTNCTGSKDTFMCWWPFPFKGLIFILHDFSTPLSFGIYWITMTYFINVLR